MEVFKDDDFVSVTVFMLKDTLNMIERAAKSDGISIENFIVESADEEAYQVLMTAAEYGDRKDWKSNA